MKYRPHRGSLEEAMKECCDVSPTLSALRSHVGDPNATVEVYNESPDKRIGWTQTFIVKNGDGFPKGLGNAVVPRIPEMIGRAILLAEGRL